MKILFVCRSNVGRSQMAAALCGLMYGKRADSAGTVVQESGQRLEERLDGTTATILAVMREVGVDMSGNVRVQVIPEMLERYDKVIVMAQADTTPDWLVAHPNVERWEVNDPVRAGLEDTRRVRDEIASRVTALMAESER